MLFRSEPTYPAWMTTLVEGKESIAASDIYTFDCETIDRKPEVLTTVCADFGVAVWKIKWKTWDAAGAFGTGTYAENDCEPSCAEGKLHEQPVSIQLKDLVTDGKKYYFITAVINQLDPKQKSFGTLIWDIGEFYREMWAYENQ